MSEKLTNDEFLARVKEKYPNGEYEFLEEYVNARTKIRVRHNCEECGYHEWEIIPNNFLRGKGCPKCSIERQKNMFRKSTTTFKKEISDLVDDEYELLSEYENAYVKVLMKHKKCSKTYYVKPHNFLSGTRCPHCNKGINLTNKEFVKRINEMYSNEEYEPLEDYVNAHTKILMKHNCEICENYEWMVSPTNFLKGTKCPKCDNISKKKSNDKFLEEVNKLYPNNEYAFLEKYKDSKTKIKVRHNCKECENYEWEIAPNDFLQKRGCPICAYRINGLNCRKEPSVFEQEFFERMGDEYTLLEEYSTCKKKILVKHNCKECNNYKWKAIPSNLLKGVKCPKCQGKYKRCLQEFKEEVFSLVKNEYEVLSDYVDRHTKVKIRHNCKKCKNYEYEVTPYGFLNGNRCPKCQGKVKNKTTKFFKEEVFDLVQDEYKVLGEYINCRTKILMNHKACNHNYLVSPRDFISGSRCPFCFKNERKSPSEFNQEVYDLVGNEYEVLEDYVNSRTKILIRHNCEKCNNFEWNVAPYMFLQGSRCPKCKISKGEQKISKVLSKKGILYEIQYKIDECKNEKSLPFDFVLIKDEKLIGLIEYDGEQHFSRKHYFGCKNEEEKKNSLEITKLRDNIKNTYCKDNKIPLLRIKYTQYKEIEAIIDHFLSYLDNYIENHAFGMSDEEYYSDRE